MQRFEQIKEERAEEKMRLMEEKEELRAQVWCITFVLISSLLLYAAIVSSLLICLFCLQVVEESRQKEKERVAAIQAKREQYEANKNGLDKKRNEQAEFRQELARLNRLRKQQVEHRASFPSQGRIIHAYLPSPLPERGTTQAHGRVQAACFDAEGTDSLCFSQSNTPVPTTYRSQDPCGCRPSRR
jgi:hypothetical protein